MFFIKRNKTKIITEDVAEVVLSNQDTIVLGAFRFTGVQKGDFFVRDTAVIDITATVEGNITALDCNIDGLVKGNVCCTNNLFLGCSAVIEGSIMAKKAVMETGCRINGTVVLGPKVEISTLAVKIMEAEMLVMEKKNLGNQENLTRKVDISKETASILDIKIMAKEQNEKNVQKNRSTSTQLVDNDDNWW
jgi:cytoskeletal protein CcmA (bactofilin family)